MARAFFFRGRVARSLLCERLVSRKTSNQGARSVNHPIIPTLMILRDHSRPLFRRIGFCARVPALSSRPLTPAAPCFSGIATWTSSTRSPPSEASTQPPPATGAKMPPTFGAHGPTVRASARVSCCVPPIFPARGLLNRLSDSRVALCVPFSPAAHSPHTP